MKRIVLLLSMLVLTVSSTAYADVTQAENNVGKTSRNIGGVNVEYDSLNFTTIDLADKVVEQAREMNPNVKEIEINQLIIPNELLASARFSRNTNYKRLAWYDLGVTYTTVRQITSKDSPLSAMFITSVAKGMTFSFSSTRTYETTLSLSGSFPSGARSSITTGLNQAISQSFSSSYKFTGPLIANGDPVTAISKKYYLTPFVDNGTWRTTGSGFPSGDLYGPYTGGYSNPKYYVMWSMNVY